MTTPFGLTDAPLVDERPERPELFLDRSLEFFRLLGQFAGLMKAVGKEPIDITMT